LDDFSAAIRLSARPEFSYYNNRGAVYAGIGRYEEALQDYVEAIRLNPVSSEALRNRAILFYKLGQQGAIVP